MPALSSIPSQVPGTDSLWTRPSASLGCPPSISSDTASPKTGPPLSRWWWTPSWTFHAPSQSSPCGSSSAWWTFSTASPLRLPICAPFMKLWKTKPRDTLWTGPRREIRPSGHHHRHFRICNGRSTHWYAFQQRQLSYISEFTMDIQHVAGKHNLVVD